MSLLVLMTQLINIATGVGGLGLDSRPVKSDTVLSTARHRCKISSELRVA